MIGKPFNQALLEMLRALAVGWDVNVDTVAGSSDIRSIMEAVAFQVADVSARADASLAEARPQAIWEAMGFAQKPAQASTGALRFKRAVAHGDPILIPAGSEARTGSEVYVRTLEDVTIMSGAASADVAARSTLTGPRGNVPAGTLTLLATPLRGIASVTNPLPFTGGQDAEAIPEQRARFWAFLSALSKTDPAALTQLALDYRDGTGRGVTRALIADHESDPNLPPGVFQLALFAAGGVPSSYMTPLRTYLRAFRAAGGIPRLLATSGVPVPVTVALAVSSLGQGAPDAARAAIGDYFAKLTFGEKVSRENLITVLTNSHAAITEVTLLSPSADVIAGRYDVLIPGLTDVAEALA